MEFKHVGIVEKSGTRILIILIETDVAAWGPPTDSAIDNWRMGWPFNQTPLFFLFFFITHALIF